MKKTITIVASVVLVVIMLCIGTLNTVRSLDFPSLLGKIGTALKSESHAGAVDEKLILTVAVGEGGQVNTTSGEYKFGEKVVLVATASEGYVFDGWYGNRGTYISSSETYELTMEKDMSLVARFAEKIENVTSYKLVGAFETLYTEFTESGVELQKETVKSAITGNFDALNTTSVTNNKIVDIYVDKLFENIEATRKEDSEDLELKEVFAETEAPAYESLMGIVDGVVNQKEEYNPPKEELTTSVENIIMSDICKDVIDESCKDEDIYTTTQAAVEKLPEETVTNIEDSIQSVYDGASEEDKAVLEQLAGLLAVNIKK